MVKNSKIKEVPYKEGSLQWQGSDIYDWVPNLPFERVLTFIGTMSTEASIKYIWADDEGHTFPMFSGSVKQLLENGHILHGTCNGPWVVVKKGSNYGIEIYEGEWEFHE